MKSVNKTITSIKGYTLNNKLSCILMSHDLNGKKTLSIRNFNIWKRYSKYSILTQNKVVLLLIYLFKCSDLWWYTIIFRTSQLWHLKSLRAFSELKIVRKYVLFCFINEKSEKQSIDVLTNQKCFQFSIFIYALVSTNYTCCLDMLFQKLNP